MAVRLGIAPFVKNQSVNPSVTEARLIFLRLLDGFKPFPASKTIFSNSVPASLYDNVFPSFALLVLERFWKPLFAETTLSSLTSDAALFSHLKSKISPEKAKEFVPNHLTLKSKSPETYKQLVHWAKTWNLKCDWCLDFAVEAMRFWLFDRAAREHRLWGHALKSNLNDFRWNAVIEHADAESSEGKFRFDCGTVSFSAAGWNYRLEEDTEWRGRVSGALLDHLRPAVESFPSGFLSKVVRCFENEVDKHIQRVKATLAKRGYKPAPSVRDYSQFGWTACYQVLGMKLSDVGREYGEPEKTVDDGINRTLKLIGLQRRPKGKKAPQPPVVGRTRKLSIREEANRKARLKKFVEAWGKVSTPDIRAVVARKIGVSDSYFRHVWIPYLLEQTGCGDYDSLIQRGTIERIKRHHSELLRD